MSRSGHRSQRPGLQPAPSRCAAGCRSPPRRSWTLSSASGAAACLAVMLTITGVRAGGFLHAACSAPLRYVTCRHTMCQSDQPRHICCCRYTDQPAYASYIAMFQPSATLWPDRMPLAIGDPSMQVGSCDLVILHAAQACRGWQLHQTHGQHLSVSSVAAEQGQPVPANAQSRCWCDRSCQPPWTMSSRSRPPGKAALASSIWLCLTHPAGRANSGEAESKDTCCPRCCSCLSCVMQTAYGRLNCGCCAALLACNCACHAVCHCGRALSLHNTQHRYHTRVSTTDLESFVRQGWKEKLRISAATAGPSNTWYEHCSYGVRIFTDDPCQYTLAIIRQLRVGALHLVAHAAGQSY